MDKKKSQSESRQASLAQEPTSFDGLRLATVHGVANSERYKDIFTERSLRALIFDAEDRISASGDKLPGNGLAVAIIRLGRKVLIDLDAFEEWLVSHRAATFQGSARAHGPTWAGARK
jgi:hypothetical protein